MTTKHDRDLWFEITKEIEAALKTGTLPINEKIRVMTKELWENYGIMRNDLNQDILIYYDMKNLHAKWDGKCKLASYVNKIVFYYLSNQLRSRRHFVDSEDEFGNPCKERVERIKPDAMDCNSNKLVVIETADKEDYDFYFNPTPEDNLIGKEYNNLIDETFNELEQKIIYGEVTISGASTISGTNYNTYKSTLRRKRNNLFNKLK